MDDFVQGKYKMLAIHNNVMNLITRQEVCILILISGLDSLKYQIVKVMLKYK